MIEVSKGSDLLIRINCSVSVNELSHVGIIYSTCEGKEVEKTTENGGIILLDDVLHAKLTSEDTMLLDRGVIKFSATVDVRSDVFEDGYYRVVSSGNTTIYLT